MGVLTETVILTLTGFINRFCEAIFLTVWVNKIWPPQLMLVGGATSVNAGRRWLFFYGRLTATKQGLKYAIFFSDACKRQSP